MIVHTFEQRTPEWHRARAGVISASNFKVAREKVKTGAPSAAAKKLAAKLAIERICGEPQEDVFETWAMRRGTELESQAISAFEVEFGHSVESIGFCTTDCKKFGASPDGLIGEAEGCEVKCPISGEQIIKVLLEDDPSDYLDQVHGNLWITGRQAWHLIIYTPQLDGVNRSMSVFKIERDEDYIQKLVADLNAFDALIEDYVQQLARKAA